MENQNYFVSYPRNLRTGFRHQDQKICSSQNQAHEHRIKIDQFLQSIYTFSMRGQMTSSTLSHNESDLLFNFKL